MTGLVGEQVAVGFRGRLEGSTLRRLQDEDGCTGKTSVGDAEAGIAQFSDPDACVREGPLVGCNGEWGVVVVVLACLMRLLLAGCLLLFSVRLSLAGGRFRPLRRNGVVRIDYVRVDYMPGLSTKIHPMSILLGRAAKRIDLGRA